MKIYSVLYKDFYPFSTFFPTWECKVVSKPEDLNGPGIVIFHGGQDIAPSLYKKGRSRWSGTTLEPSKRDSIELAIMDEAIKQKILIMGICRGFQLICAKAGGYLYQDVDNHSGYHWVTSHDGEKFQVNSMHHQMVAPWDVPHEIRAVSEPLTNRVYDVDEVVKVPKEVESAYFPAIHAFGVQWHPEVMRAEGHSGKWIHKQLDSLLHDEHSSH